jgi:hypothetical protein
MVRTKLDRLNRSADIVGGAKPDGLTPPTIVLFETGHQGDRTHAPNRALTPGGP